MKARTDRTVSIIYALRYTGDTLEAIGDRHNVTKQSVHAILQRLRRDGIAPAHRKPQPWKRPNAKVGS